MVTLRSLPIKKLGLSTTTSSSSSYYHHDAVVDNPLFSMGSARSPKETEMDEPREDLEDLMIIASCEKVTK